MTPGLPRGRADRFGWFRLVSAHREGATIALRRSAICRTFRKLLPKILAKIRVGARDPICKGCAAGEARP
jgi:hypothetical protein